MNCKILIAGILFSISSEIPLNFKAEENQFIFHDGNYLKEVPVTIYKCKKLPEPIGNTIFYGDHICICQDTQGNEVRRYTANFLPGKPEYAVSVYADNNITIYYAYDNRVLGNPNIPLWNMLHMETIFLEQDAFVFHCSYLMYRGKAILFSAPSGTGKTTQAKLWEKNFSDARIINGDKCCIRRINNCWHACGYPFHGSADECYNEDYPIGAIVVVRQSPSDFIKEMTAYEKNYALYSESTVNSWNENAINHMLDLAAELSVEVNIIEQHCTMKDNAATVLFKYMEEKGIFINEII